MSNERNDTKNKGGRPPAPLGDLKTKRGFKASDNEWEIWTRAAKKAGISVAAFLRQSATSAALGPRKVDPVLEVLDKYQSVLDKIRAELKQAST